MEEVDGMEHEEMEMEEELDPQVEYLQQLVRAKTLYSSYKGRVLYVGEFY